MSNGYTRTTALDDCLKGLAMWSFSIAEVYYLADAQWGIGWLGGAFMVVFVPLFMLCHKRWIAHTSIKEWPGEMLAEDDEHLIKYDSGFSVGMHECKYVGAEASTKGWSFTHLKADKTTGKVEVDFVVSVSRKQLEDFCRNIDDLIKKNPMICDRR